MPAAPDRPPTAPGPRGGAVGAIGGAAATDFRLYHSNSLEVLAGLLAAELRTPAPGQPLLAPDTVLIPQARSAP